MLILEEWEKREMETSKALEEADEYHEHPKYEHRKIDKVINEEEEIGSSKSGDEEEDAIGKNIIQACDDDLKEEMA